MNFDLREFINQLGPSSEIEKVASVVEDDGYLEKLASALDYISDNLGGEPTVKVASVQKAPATLRSLLTKIAEKNVTAPKTTEVDDALASILARVKPPVVEEEVQEAPVTQEEVAVAETEDVKDAHVEFDLEGDSDVSLEDMINAELGVAGDAEKVASAELTPAEKASLFVSGILGSE